MTDSTPMMDTSAETSSNVSSDGGTADVAAVQMAQAASTAPTTTATEEGVAAMSHIPGSLKDLKGGELEPAAGCPVQTVVRAPDPGEVVTMEVKPGEALQVAFEIEPAKMHMVGNDLVIEHDGGQVVLVGYEQAQPQLLDVNCQPLVPEIEPAAGLFESAGPLYRLVAQGVLPDTELPYVPITPPGNPPQTPPESPPPPPPPPPEVTSFSLTISPADPQEGLPLAFQVNTAAHDQPVTIDFQAISGTAIAGVDFEAGNFRVLFPGSNTWIDMGGPNGTQITLPPGVTSFMVEIDTFQDNLLEGQEQFTLTATVVSPSFDIVSVKPGPGIIEDNENLKVDISDGTGTEGSADGVVFTITLHGPGNAVVSVGDDVTLDLTATNAGGTDTATPGSDFAAGGFQYSIDGGTTWLAAGGVDGTLVTIPAGMTSILVRVPVGDDSFIEGTESFTLTGSVVSSPGYHNVTVDAGNGIILDDESGPVPTPGVDGQGRETVVEGGNVTVPSTGAQLFINSGIQISGPDNGKATHVTLTMTNAQAGDRLSFGNGFTVDNSGALLLNGVATGLTAAIAAAAGGLIIVQLDGIAHAGTFDDAMQSLHLVNLDGSFEATGARGIDVVVSQGGVESTHLNTDFNLAAPHFDLSMTRGDITTPDYTDPLPGASSKIEGDGNANVIHGNGGNDVIYGGGGDDQILTSGSGQNVLAGGAGNDSLQGGDGDDKLLGGSGHDQLTGNGGLDQLFGDSGDDQLSGGSGNDTLVGGSGSDHLTGGAGADTFAIQNVHEVDSDGNHSVDGADVIHDFNAGQGDSIDISGLLSNLGDPGNAHATAQFVADGANTNVQVDLGGGAGFQTIIVVENADPATVQANTTT